MRARGEDPPERVVGDSEDVCAGEAQFVEVGERVDSLVESPREAAEDENRVLRMMKLRAESESLKSGGLTSGKEGERFSSSRTASTHFMRSVAYWSVSLIVGTFCSKT